MTYIGKVLRGTRGEGGATAVEFTILLPVMLVTFAAIVEGSRIYWNYQGAVVGVRDAARYLARITNNDVCSGGTAPANSAGIATGIITRNLDTDGSGPTGFPSGVSLSTTTPVSAVVICRDLSSQGIPEDIPIYRVNATVEIQLPFSTLFDLFGNYPNGVMTSTITDQSRIYGI